MKRNRHASNLSESASLEQRKADDLTLMLPDVGHFRLLKFRFSDCQPHRFAPRFISQPQATDKLKIKKTRNIHDEKFRRQRCPGQKERNIKWEERVRGSPPSFFFLLLSSGRFAQATKARMTFVYTSIGVSKVNVLAVA